MSPPLYNVTGLILAGGASKRMGRPKPNLPVGGETMVGRVMNQIFPLCAEIIIVTRKPTDFLSYPVKIVRDLVPGQGPLGGLTTGLFYASKPWVLALACDLPFLNIDILKLILDKTRTPPNGPQAIVPQTEKGWQPLVAIYSKQCFRPAQRALFQGERKVDLLRKKGILWVPIPENQLTAIDPELHSFTNINTPEDLTLAEIEIEGTASDIEE